MYEELVEALRLCVKYGKAEDALANAQQAADAIEELSKPRWIPVTERLPEDGSAVLAYLTYDARITAASYYRGTWQDCVMGRLYLTEEGFVTHWMPLPEPPKEEK